MILCETDDKEEYAQCEFARGQARTVGFIPLWAARQGNLIELKEMGGMGLWKITHVGKILSKDHVRKQERAYRQFQGSTRGGGIDA